MTETHQFHPTPDAGVGDLGSVLQATLPLLSQLLEAVPARVVVIDVNECFAWANHEFFKFTHEAAERCGRIVRTFLNRRAAARPTAARWR